LVVVEALSSGMPVGAFYIPGAPKDVLTRDAGSVVKPFDVKAMVEEALKYYYEMWRRDPKEFIRISDNCRRYALNFDWGIIAKHVDKMFQAIKKD